MKRIQLILPDDLHTKFKIVCTLHGKDMSEIIRNWIEEYVEREEKRKLIVFPKVKK
jgi:metal-responsive CopG/Arc/MetJ family transcriptional regulator